MDVLARIVVALVALLHVYILILEMFLWTAPSTRRRFGTDADFARSTRSLAANQGLYNGFLAAGLVWGLLHPDHAVGMQIQIFFLACVLAAGLYGALTAKRSILFVQALPAAIGLACVWLAG